MTLNHIIFFFPFHLIYTVEEFIFIFFTNIFIPSFAQNTVSFFRVFIFLLILAIFKNRRLFNCATNSFIFRRRSTNIQRNFTTTSFWRISGQLHLRILIRNILFFLLLFPTALLFLFKQFHDSTTFISSKTWLIAKFNFEEFMHA